MWWFIILLFIIPSPALEFVRLSTQKLFYQPQILRNIRVNKQQVFTLMPCGSLLSKQFWVSICQRSNADWVNVLSLLVVVSIHDFFHQSRGTHSSIIFILLNTNTFNFKFSFSLVAWLMMKLGYGLKFILGLYRSAAGRKQIRAARRLAAALCV